MLVLFLATIWIPADFGLAFYSGQWRRMPPGKERVWLPPQTPSTPGTIQTQVMNRMDSAVLKNVTAEVLPPACDPAVNMQVVTVTVAGEYNFYFINYCGS
jgi:hypothetical protein